MSSEDFDEELAMHSKSVKINNDNDKEDKVIE